MGGEGVAQETDQLDTAPRLLALTKPRRTLVAHLGSIQLPILFCAGQIRNLRNPHFEQLPDFLGLASDAARVQRTGWLLQEFNAGHTVGTRLKELFNPARPGCWGYRPLDRHGDLAFDCLARFPREITDDTWCRQDEVPLVQNYSDLRQKLVCIHTGADFVADGIEDARCIRSGFESNETQNVERELLMSIENTRRSRVKGAQCRQIWW